MPEVSSAVELVEAIDIVEEISKYVKLTSYKQELRGLCPFHTEDTPSFYVNPSKRLFHCFGCLAGGNVINFRSQISGLTLQDAIEALAKDYNLSLSNTSNKKQYKDVLGMAKQSYVAALKQSEVAKAYLKQRGLSAETIQMFEIGYANDGWNNLDKMKGFPVSEAIEIGLLLKGKKGHYDRFRNRIMFPIVSHHGRVVGFGGRALGDEKPKYINSSDSSVYHKSEILYGLHQALKENVKEMIVVEGYMDVIALHQAGFKGAIAALGTAFTKEHFQLISKYADKLIFCFDGDEAGHNAAKKAFHTILPYLRDQLSCYFLTLDQDDPDDYIKKHGKKAFADLLEKAKPFSQYLLEDLVPAEGSGLEDQARQLAGIKEILKKMPSSILRNLIIKKIGMSPKVPKVIKPKVVLNGGEKFIVLIFECKDIIALNQKTIEPILPQLPSIIQKALRCIWDKQETSLASFLLENSINMPAESIPLLSMEARVQEIADWLKHYQLNSLENKIKEIMDKPMNDQSEKMLQDLLKVKYLLKKKKIVLDIE